jgi:hypothetical protein
MEIPGAELDLQNLVCLEQLEVAYHGMPHLSSRSMRWAFVYSINEPS